MDDKPKHKPEEILAAALGFDEDDLEANRAGVLSERQRKWLRGEQREASASWTGGVLLVLLLFTAALALSTQIQLIMTLLLMAVIAMFLLVIFIYYTVRRRHLGELLRANTVQAVEGYVHLDIVDRRGGSTYALQIEDRVFFIAKQVFLAFKNGDPYRLYYLADPEKLFSAEWLRE